jgi:hypothetical protein
MDQTQQLPDKMPVPENPIYEQPTIETIHTTDQPIIDPNNIQSNNQTSPFIEQNNVEPVQSTEQTSPFIEQNNVEPFQPATTIPDSPIRETQVPPMQETQVPPIQKTINITPPAMPEPPSPPETSLPSLIAPLSLETSLPLKIKHEIVDLFWLINYNGYKTGEVPIISIAYNARFKNIRIVLYEINDAYQTTYIDTKKCKKITTFNIFSEKAFEIIKIYNSTQMNQQPIVINNLERLHGKQNDNWSPNQTIFYISKQIIQCQVINTNQYVYSFTDIQLEMFLKSLDFLINGKSWIVSLMSSIIN